MDKASFEGKTIGDVIDDDTHILTNFREGYDVKAVKIRDIFLRESGPYTAFADFNNYLVICFENGRAKALFHVYDIMNVTLNGKHGLVTAIGHDTSHRYWYSDGDYEEQHIR